MFLDITYHNLEILSLIESYFAACKITYLARHISPMIFLIRQNQKQDMKNRFTMPNADTLVLHLKNSTLNSASWVAVEVDKDIVTSNLLLFRVKTAFQS